MKTFLQFLTVVALAMCSINGVTGQDLVNVTIQTTSVDHNFQCCTDFIGISCGFLPDLPEPRYRISAQTMLGGAGAGFGAVAVINPGDDVACGNLAASNTILNLVGVCADEVELSIDMWEEDGCGSDNSYNTGCANDDENRTQVTPNHILSGITPGVSTPFSAIGTGGYAVNYTILYTLVGAPVNTSTVTVGCPGDFASLSATIGQAVVGMDFLWYVAPTGGAVQGTGSTFTPALTSSTTYYVAYGNIATCETARTPVNVVVSSNSTDPISLSSSPAALCGAGTVDLVINGGTLGTGASWEWYDGNPNSGGTFLTSTAATASLTGYAITATTNYFVRAEGACDSSTLVNVSVVVSSPNTAPSSISATSSTICSGNTADLTVIGGVLGSGASWTWYDTDPTGGSPAPLFMSTSPFYLGAAPPTTTTYFVRAEGCDTTIAQQTTITVVAGSGDPSSLTGAPLILCGAGTVDLTINGGTLGTGATWEWYDGDPNGASTFLTSTGATASLIGYAITATTNYFVRAEGACGPSNTVNVNVVVSSPNTAPSGVTVTSSTICSGNTTDLTITGGVLGSGATWTWYDTDPTVGTPASLFASSSAFYLRISSN